MKKIEKLFCILTVGASLFVGVSCSDSIEPEQDDSTNEVIDNDDEGPARRTWCGNVTRIGRVGDDGHGCSHHRNGRSHPKEN